MATLVITQAAQLTECDDSVAAGNTYDLAEVYLFKTPVVITDQTTLADLTVADYTGYAAQPVAAWASSYIAPDGTIQRDGGRLLFTPTGDAVPNTIYGWALVKPAVVGPPAVPAYLLAAMLLDEPVVLNSIETTLPIDVVIPYGS